MWGQVASLHAKHFRLNICTIWYFFVILCLGQHFMTGGIMIAARGSTLYIKLRDNSGAPTLIFHAKSWRSS